MPPNLKDYWNIIRMFLRIFQLFAFVTYQYILIARQNINLELPCNYHINIPPMPFNYHLFLSLSISTIGGVTCICQILSYPVLTPCFYFSWARESTPLIFRAKTLPTHTRITNSSPIQSYTVFSLKNWTYIRRYVTLHSYMFDRDFLNIKIYNLIYNTFKLIKSLNSLKISFIINP